MSHPATADALSAELRSTPILDDDALVRPLPAMETAILSAFEESSGLDGRSEAPVSPASTDITVSGCSSSQGTITGDFSATTVLCDGCSKRFCDSQHLQWHRVVSGVPEGAVCCVCGGPLDLLESQRFEQKRAAEEEARGEIIARKAFDCKRCSASFTRGDRLLAHSRMHTGEKPFKCHLCTRSFSRKDRLKAHVRYHNGETPHRCHVCNKSFTQAAHLTKHKKVFHVVGGRSYGQRPRGTKSTAFGSPRTIDDTSKSLLDTPPHHNEHGFKTAPLLGQFSPQSSTETLSLTAETEGEDPLREPFHLPQSPDALDGMEMSLPSSSEGPETSEWAQPPLPTASAAALGMHTVGPVVQIMGSELRLAVPPGGMIFIPTEGQSYVHPGSLLTSGQPTPRGTGTKTPSGFLYYQPW